MAQQHSIRRKYQTIAIILTIVCVALFLLFSNIHSRLSNLSPEAVASADKLYLLTEEGRVLAYLKKNNKLPPYYVKKQKAEQLGWNSREGNLCDISDYKAIGGDRFYNREKKLPEMKKRKWFEADINYRCGHRGSDRLLYSSDGLFYVSYDHYKTFKERR